MQATDPNAKPYAFVALSPEGKRVDTTAGHEKWTGLSGFLACAVKAITPLHVASGLTVPTDHLRQYTDITWPATFHEPLVIDHYRTTDRRAIPASSLKGCVRSVVEAISQSCVSKTRAKDERTRNHVPPSPLEKSRECRKPEKTREGPRPCPACRLFGAMGFGGKVTFHDALQTSGAGAIALRPAPNQPNRDFNRDHPIHKDKYYQRVDGRLIIKGRKFYRHFEPPQDQRIRYEPVEVCASESVFPFRIEFQNLSSAELGLLLVALGQGNGVSVLKLGGSKPFGYGSVEVIKCDGEVLDSEQQVSRILSWEESAKTRDWADIRDQAIEEVRKSLIVEQQLASLKKILNKSATHTPEDVAHWQKGEDQYE
jgi:CRISPR/Cas system CSM-associated protein Csm3 (group 7 of RAMP superfamily)